MMGRSGRIGLIAALGLALGCSRGDGNSSTSFGPPPWELPDTEGTQSTQGPGETEAAETSGADGTSNATSGPVSSSGGTTMPPMGSDGPPPGDSGGGTFGDDGGEGMQPGSGWWSHCIPNMIGCSAGFSCLSTDAGDDGICTQPCAPAGNPGSCGMSPGGTNMPICLTVGGNSLCALGCEGGLTCPGGMICIAESDDLGPISICI